MLLPDILRYDAPSRRLSQRRKLIDDVYSYRFAWMTYGKSPQGLKPHADLLTDSPTSAANPKPAGLLRAPLRLRSTAESPTEA